MSKAIKRAKERYWLELNNIETRKKYVAYVEGYHQAEKDNELTCGDIETILNVFLDFKIESVKSRKTKRYTDEEYCQEVLKRFKDFKERKGEVI